MKHIFIIFILLLPIFNSIKASPTVEELEENLAAIVDYSEDKGKVYDSTLLEVKKGIVLLAGIGAIFIGINCRRRLKDE